MKKWEYEVIAVQVQSEKDFVHKSITEVLNDAGANGWELVRIELRPLGCGEYYECVMKREKLFTTTSIPKYH
jgi:hypothetical protein